jgi:hypothetical protein
MGINVKGSRFHSHRDFSEWLLCGSELSEIEFISSEPKVVDDVGNDTAGNVPRMPRESDEQIRVKRIRVVAMAAGGGTQELAANFPKSAIQLPTIHRGIFAHAQAASTNLSRKAGGMGRPVSMRASK